ncbi:chloride channel protein [Nocardia sp. 852002-20019_SCH5090214]|uniref:chloride channel protein n=1 Tax=Nocardia TaxID=1817 RepID=UPI0007EC0659|nr:MULTISPECIES: chloride channel protein [Nocardia]OBF75373.1 chloride channel protein [Mycobacterium sp. 852002-51759_SCH5129042]MBF6275978.1 chloride channel protein [Nocardia nova]OBA42678.1 chloride channel protein [Nocardia sp. 852002-20019_SCH5090214]OBB35558.1 chloride channel protein [Nocardia sp. 852002-51244_SCH5132740]PPJ07193.1 chloride channel protein [Nocardia nova]
MSAGHSRATHLGDFQVTPRLLLIAGLAIPVGGAAAGAAYALLKLIGFITNLVFYQRLSTEMVAPGATHHPWWLVLSAPVVGGLIIGVMARYGSEKIRGHGMPEAIEAILTGGSRVQPRVALLKPASAAISIGSGGPFGAEGPIIMTGGAVGSILAQLLKLSADERKTLLVAGSAAGMAATFNAPLAAILLAVELLLFEWRPRSFVPVVAAVVTGTICRWAMLGNGPVFAVATDGRTPGALSDGLALIPGITGGLLAIAATAMVYFAEDSFAKLPVHWMWWPAIGGLIIGIGGLFEPRALGVGYDVIDQLLTGHATLSLIVGILVVKTLIWSLSLGSGTSGGVLAPVFMIGAALGAAEGGLLPHVTAGFWAMCGLAAVVGGVMRSPLTGIVFTCELTHAWNDVLPLAVASVSAYAVSVLLLKRSVLTEKIARRRLHLTREYTTDPLETFFTHEVMTADPLVLGIDDLIDPILPQTHYAGLYPVVDGSGALVGVTTRQVLQNCLGTTVAAATLSIRTSVHPDNTLREVANALALAHVTAAPVVARDDPNRLCGIVTLEQLLHARRRDLHEEHHRERLLVVREEPAAEDDKVTVA